MLILPRVPRGGGPCRGEDGNGPGETPVNGANMAGHSVENPRQGPGAPWRRVLLAAMRRATSPKRSNGMVAASFSQRWSESTAPWTSEELLRTRRDLSGAGKYRPK